MKKEEIRTLEEKSALFALLREIYLRKKAEVPVAENFSLNC